MAKYKMYSIYDLPWQIECPECHEMIHSYHRDEHVEEHIDFECEDTCFCRCHRCCAWHCLCCREHTTENFRKCDEFWDIEHVHEPIPPEESLPNAARFNFYKS